MLWKKFFTAKGTKYITLIIFSLLSFGMAVFWDVLAGNIALFEALLLYTGFYFFVYKKNASLLAVFIFAAAFFKIAPLFFASILMLHSLAKYRIQLALMAMGSLLVALLSWYLMPEHSSSFVQIVANLDERGDLNPASLALIRDVYEIFFESASQSIADEVLYVVYAAILCSIVYYKMNRYELTRFEILVLMILMYALIAPRMKNYSYILLVPVSLMIIQSFGTVTKVILMVLFCSLLLVPYQVLFLTFLLLILFFHLKRSGISLLPEGLASLQEQV